MYRFTIIYHNMYVVISSNVSSSTFLLVMKKLMGASEDQSPIMRIYGGNRYGAQLALMLCTYPMMLYL